MVLWEEVLQAAEERGIAPEAVLREEVQKACLTHLSLRGFFKRHVFQGGTALRLFYGSPRYSEDLDFVLSRDAGGPPEVVLAGLEEFIGFAFPFLDNIRVEKQKETAMLQRFAIRVLAAGPRKSLRVNLEIASVPSYENEVLLLTYPPFTPATRVETAREILADKLVALSLRKYLKGRDLWDIYLLVKHRGAAPDPALAQQKALDYRATGQEFVAGLEAAVQKVAVEGASVLEREMPRFLPRSVLETSRATGWDEVVETVCRVVALAKEPLLDSGQKTRGD